MKFLPTFMAASALVALSACATQQPTISSIGTSPKAPQVVAQCISTRWADKTQTPVVSQTRVANDFGVDVLVPGQQPGGDAAVVRQSPQGPGTWVGYRSTTNAAPDPSVTAAVSSCL